MIPAIILAKGESNRIPRKNMKLFCNEPLVYWSIEQARNSKLVDAVAVSTESEEIKQIAKLMGCIIIDRPKKLTACIANHAIVHAINYLRETWDFRDVVTLLPTSPVRLPHDIDGLIATHITSNNVNSASYCEQLETNIWEKVSGNRIQLKLWSKHHEYLIDGGGMSCSNVDWYLEYSKRIPFLDAEFDADPFKYDAPQSTAYVMKEWQTVELDLPEHWGITECVMQKYILGPLGRNCYKRYKEIDHGTKG